jgi:hypothetical protein
LEYKHTSESQSPVFRAYRAQGLPTKDVNELKQLLQAILKTIGVEAELEIRTLAQSFGAKDEYTSVFEFVDGMPHKCEGSHPVPAAFLKNEAPSSTFAKRRSISIDTNFLGMTILHEPDCKDAIE